LRTFAGRDERRTRELSFNVHVTSYELTIEFTVTVIY
jgi:hypothetical protein